jgi:large subunit ribosomal protein L24
MAARLRKGDQVVVISGKDRGKTGRIKQVLPADGKVIVEGLNLVKRHTRPTGKTPEGAIVEKEAALWACKVMPVDPQTGKPTRVRFKIDGTNKKVRIAKSGEEIPIAQTD